MEPIIVTSHEALRSAIQKALDVALNEQLPVLIRQATTKPFFDKKRVDGIDRLVRPASRI